MESSKKTEVGSSSSNCGVGGEIENFKKDMSDKDSEVGDDDVVDDDDDKGFPGFVPGPFVSLKEQIEKDKDDESLRRWKEKLLGCVDSDLNGHVLPEVKFYSIGIISDDIGEINVSLPIDESRSDNVLFTLREGSQYQLNLTFSVLHNIVSGLTYSNTVWKGPSQVDKMKGMLGTFSPQREPYMHTLEEETTPSGLLARGIYSAKLKFEDDDRRCHMELNYSFEIKKRT